MPRRKKPKWDYRARYPLSDDGIRIYSDKEIQKLALDYGISNRAQIDELRHRLEGAALVYRICKQNWDEAPRPGEMRAAINKIEGLAKGLLEHLERLDDKTASVFWLPETELMGLLRQTETTESRFGHTFNRWVDEQGDTNVSYLGGDDLFEALKIIQGYCAEARNNLPDDKGGPRRSEALRMWAVNVEKIWEEVFQRPFTLNTHQGQPTSKAASFAVEAFKIVDRKIPSSRVMNAMKTVIASRRKRRSGKNPSLK